MDKYTKIIKTILNGYKRIKIASFNNENEVILLRTTSMCQKTVWYHFEINGNFIEINSYISLISNGNCTHKKQKRILIKL